MYKFKQNIGLQRNFYDIEVLKVKLENFSLQCVNAHWLLKELPWRQ